MEILKEILIWLWTLAGVRFLVGHTCINVVVAVMAAVRDEEDGFQVKRLLEFLGKKLLPYVLVYGTAKYFGMDAGLEWLAPAVWVLIEATLAADLAENLERLGVPLPESVSRVLVGKK